MGVDGRRNPSRFVIGCRRRLSLTSLRSTRVLYREGKETMDRRTADIRKRLTKKAKKGFRGYPIGTIAVYGPDDHRASKLVASIVESEESGPTEMQKWHDDQGDVRNSAEAIAGVMAFLERHGPRSVVMTDRIIGCPHEEGIDFQGPTCPLCPFWAHRDRWTGEVIQ